MQWRISLSGHKDILGIWIGDNESASFWLTVCNDLKNRGVKDIMIAYKDGLTGFSDAISAVFPKSSEGGYKTVKFVDTFSISKN